jgi:two-component sensor histidine kinase
MRLSRRLLLLASVVLVPGLTAALYNEISLRKEREAEVNKMVLRSTQHGVTELRRVFESLRSVLQAAAATSEVASLERERCDAYLQRIKQPLEFAFALGVADTNGEVRCSNIAFAQVNVADRVFFKSAMEHRTFVVGDFVLGRATGTPQLPVAMPLVTTDERTIGVIYATLSLAWLQKTIEERGLDLGASLTIADRNGTILARDPLPARFVGTQIPEPFMHLVRGNSEGVSRIASQDGTHRIIAYVPPSRSGIDLYVSSGMAVDRAFDLIDRSTRIALFLTVASTIFAFLLALLLSRRFVERPMAQLLEAIEAWRGGSRQRTGMLPGQGEFGALGAALDDLFDEIESKQVAQTRTETQRVLLLKEMSHRLKNALAVVQSVARQSFKGIPNAANAVRTFENRVSALAKAHDFILSGRSDESTIEEVIERAVQPFSEAGKSFRLNGPELSLPAKASFALTLILHELCTNAVKYGSLSAPLGFVAIDWRLALGRLSLSWREAGGPVVTAPEAKGYGSILVENAFGAEFEARIVREFTPGGLNVTIDFKLSGVM